MSLASQQEVPRYQDEEESSYASQSPAGRRASEANYSSPSRYDNRSDGVSIENRMHFRFSLVLEVLGLTTIGYEFTAYFSIYKVGINQGAY